MAQILTDTYLFVPKLVEEASDINKRMVVEGIFQKADVKNANGRIYPRKVFEKIFSNDQFTKALNERRVLGCLDHPEDGKSRLARTSHVVLSNRMLENGDIIGRAEILDTPDGKVLQELCRAGIPTGVSSRGSGTVTRNSKGEDVVNEDYVLDTYDFVYAPSTAGAYPKLVVESTDNVHNSSEEISMNAKEKYTALEGKASSVLSAKPGQDASSRQVLESAAADLILDLTRLVTESPEIKDLASSLIEDLKAKRKELRESYSQGTADTGVRRETPMEAKPPAGEGGAVNFGDEGPLAGVNAGKTDFMIGGIQPIVTEDKKEIVEGEKPAFFAKKDKEDDDKEDKEEDDDDKNESVEMLTGYAEQLVEMEETEDNSVARAFAAAYLLERHNRKNESETFTAVIGRMQEKIQEAVANGTLTVSGSDEKLQEKYEVACGVIEELTGKLRNLSAKVYAEQELEKVGLKGDKDARKTVAEAIKKAPTKTSIDEAIAALVPVKGMKVKKLTEDKTELPLETVEGKVAKLNEVVPDNEHTRGLALARRLTETLNYSRSR